MKPKSLFSFLLTFILAACSINCAFNTDQDKVVRASVGIANFDLPAGYNPEFSASVKGYSLVSYNPGDGHSHLYLVQSQNDADTEKLAQAMNDLVPGKSDPKLHTTVIETRPVTVRGQETTLIITEGTNSEGDVYRQVMVAFQGKKGPALLVFSEPASTWNPDTVNTLVGSIR